MSAREGRLAVTLPGMKSMDRSWLRRNGVFVALGVVGLLALASTPNFLSVTNLRLQVVQAVPVLLVAVGMALVVGTRGIDLSVGAVMAIAAATVPWYVGYGGIAAAGIAVAFAGLAGLVTGSLVAFARVQPIVASLGVMVAGRGLAAIVGGEIKTVDDDQFMSLGTGSAFGVPYVVIISIVVVCLVLFALRKMTFGRVLLAVGGNPRAAQLAGLPVRKALMTAYIVCALLAGVAGVLVAARASASDPTKVGLLIELTAITAVVLGGTPLAGGQVRIGGTVAAVLLLQLLTSTLIAHNVPDSMTQIIQAFIVVLAMLVQREEVKA